MNPPQTQQETRPPAYPAPDSALLSSVLDSSISGILYFQAIRDSADPQIIRDFRFITANQTAAILVGQSLSTMVGNTLLTLFPGNIETGLFDLYCHTTQTGEPGKREVYYNHDGLDFWLDVSTRKLEDGFVVTFTDISAAKQTQHDAERAARELTEVINASQTGIFVFTPVRDEAGVIQDFRFRAANRMLAGYVGQTPEVITGELGSKWFPDYKTNGLFELYRDTCETGNQNHFEFHYDGSGIDVWLDIQSVRLGDDEIVVTFSDHTVLKRLQQQMQASVDELRRSNESLEGFAYVASHDLQEPLRKINTLGDLLQTRYGDVLPAPAIGMLGRIQGAATRMSTLIEDLLTYSRVSARPLNRTTVDLEAVLGEVVADLDVALREKGAVVHYANLPVLQADALMMRQLFQNLLSNAIKFSRAGIAPEIHITGSTASASDGGAPRLEGLASGPYHLIEVRDNGIGFDPQYATRIFQIFQRLHGRTEYPGTGVGLSIVQKLVDVHGGKITAEGKVGEGATFRVALPAEG